MRAKVGSILKGFSVHRLDGTVERYDMPLHNAMSQSIITSTAIFTNTTSTSTGNITAARTIVAMADKIVISPVGTYEVTTPGERINIISGDTFPASSVIYLYDHDDYAFVTATTTTYRLLSKTFPLGPLPGGVAYYTSGLATAAIVGNAVAMNASYSAGVLQSKNSAPYVLTAGSNLTVNAIAFRESTSTNFWNGFNLPAPVSLLTGETIAVSTEDFVITLTFDDYAPREFLAAGCPVSGISASGRYQRLLAVLGTSDLNSIEASSTSLSNPRIYLMSDANKIVIPSDFSSTVINPATLTPLESIVAQTTFTSPSPANNATASRQWWGEAVTGGSVKQIILGNTTSLLYSVIEFDTPQTINPGQVFYFNQSIQVVPDFAAP